MEKLKGKIPEKHKDEAREQYRLAKVRLLPAFSGGARRADLSAGAGVRQGEVPRGASSALHLPTQEGRRREPAPPRLPGSVLPPSPLACLTPSPQRPSSSSSTAPSTTRSSPRTLRSRAATKERPSSGIRRSSKRRRSSRLCSNALRTDSRCSPSLMPSSSSTGMRARIRSSRASFVSRYRAFGVRLLIFWGRRAWWKDLAEYVRRVLQEPGYVMKDAGSCFFLPRFIDEG